MNLLKYILIFTVLSSSSAVAYSDNTVPYLEANDISVIEILNKAEVYPNPAEDFIYLKINDKNLSEAIDIEVMSIIGTEMDITHEKIGEGLYKINIKSIPSGHYYVMLTIDSDKALKRFIKK